MGVYMRDFSLLRNKPRDGPSVSIMERAIANSSSVPQRVPSCLVWTFTDLEFVYTRERPV